MMIRRSESDKTSESPGYRGSTQAIMMTRRASLRAPGVMMQVPGAGARRASALSLSLAPKNFASASTLPVFICRLIKVQAHQGVPYDCSDYSYSCHALLTLSLSDSELPLLKHFPIRSN
eukprot:2460584-Rhodomonas_salina.2